MIATNSLFSPVNTRTKLVKRSTAHSTSKPKYALTPLSEEQVRAYLTLLPDTAQ
jgi:hypothetical protein